jgi:hypothetical protein
METISLQKARERTSPGSLRRHAGGKRSSLPEVIKLVALLAQQKTGGKRIPGQLKGRIFYTPDVFDPLTDQELEGEGFG